MRRLFFLLVIILILLWACPVFAQPSLVSISINEDSISGPGSMQLTATGTFSDGSKRPVTEGLTWVSSDSSIASFSSSGRLHFTGKSGTISVSVYVGGVYDRKTYQVKPWLEGISIESTLYYSKNPYRLMLKGRFSDGTTRYLGPEDQVVWSSTNPWVAWVNSQGVVTFTGEAGYVSIIAVAGQYSDSVNTTVDTGDESSTWRTGIRIKEDLQYSPTPVQLTLVAVRSDQSEEVIPASGADWSSDNPQVARVDSEGVLTFTGKPGFATIKVSFGGYHYQTLVRVNRFLENITINHSLNYEPTMDGTPLPLTATARYNDGSEFIQSSGLTWSVDNQRVATISEDGVLIFTGQAGRVTVSVQGEGYQGTVLEDSVVITVPQQEDKPVPKRLFIDSKPISPLHPYSPRVYCVYSNGNVRDVTEEAQLLSLTPQLAGVYQGQVYLFPAAGQVVIKAGFNSLEDMASGYYAVGGKGGRVHQIRIKENKIIYSHQPVKLTGLAVYGNGSVRDVTTALTWRSSQPLVARVNRGEVTFSGRPGKTVISAEGFGFRDQLVVEVYPEDLPPRIEKLVIEGELTKAASQLRAVAIYNDGTTRDVSTEAVWNTTNKNVAIVTTHGSVMFLKERLPVTITAHYQGTMASLSS
jgi:hypothetical protein